MATILFVDDEAFIRSTFPRTFRAEAYEVLVAASGREAIELLASRRIDVLVTDQQMPGMSGAELLAYVRIHFPAVVGMILTGEPGAHDFGSGSGLAYRILYKPIPTRELKAAIAEALESRRPIP